MSGLRRHFVNFSFKIALRETKVNLLLLNVTMHVFFDFRILNIIPGFHENKSNHSNGFSHAWLIVCADKNLMLSRFQQ